MNRLTSSLHSSGDSDGPCLILTPQNSLSNSPLSSSLDEVTYSVAKLFRTPSPVPPAAKEREVVTTTQLLPFAPQLLPITSQLIQTKPDYVQLMRTIDHISPFPQFAERIIRCSVAAKFENFRSKNRYDDVLPTDKDLIKVSSGTGYINASAFKGIIITQGPLAATLVDFWLMLFEQRVAHLISLTDHTEVKNEKVVEKTYPYWNPRLHYPECAKHPPVKDELLFETRINDKVIQVSVAEVPQVLFVNLAGGSQCVIGQVFTIKYGDELVHLQHWHYVNWPDHSTCEPKVLLQLIELLLRAPNPGKKAVHCSAGIGRSGTFAVLYHLILQYLETKIIPTENDVLAAIVELRQTRPGSVQTPAQLQLIFDTLTLFVQKYPPK